MAGSTAPHNGAITWRHLLQQTSEWEGTLFGKSDIIDRNRNLAVEGQGPQGRCAAAATRRAASGNTTTCG